MKKVKPKVVLVASTKVNEHAIKDYLVDLGVDEEKIQSTLGWHSTGSPNQYIGKMTSGEQLVTFAGKLCYNSFQPGLNPNVSKVREDPKEYLDNILKSCHGSVLEHASYSFLFSNVSRVFTHELVRHRAGTAMSQESLRYVLPTDIGFFVPKLLDDPEIIEIIEG